VDQQSLTPVRRRFTHSLEESLPGFGFDERFEFAGIAPAAALAVKGIHNTFPLPCCPLRLFAGGVASFDDRFKVFQGTHRYTRPNGVFFCSEETPGFANRCPPDIVLKRLLQMLDRPQVFTDLHEHGCGSITSARFPLPCLCIALFDHNVADDVHFFR
jgi:hypothetical protein